MDENQKVEEEKIIVKENPNGCHKHPFWKCLLCGLMVFLGAYCAFYVVTDWHYKAMMKMHHKAFMEDKFEEFSPKEMKKMENFMNQGNKKFKKNGNIIHLQQNNNEYRVIIDLRAFDNNENNVQVKTNGNILTINGRTVRKSKYDEQITEFQQSYLFGNNVKLDQMSKGTYGSFYIISIPIQKENPDEE